MYVYLTVYGLQFIVPEVECDEFGPGTQAQRWRPLQAVVAQVQVLQLTQGLRDTGRHRAINHKQEKGKLFLKCSLFIIKRNLQKFSALLNLVMA